MFLEARSLVKDCPPRGRSKGRDESSGFVRVFSATRLRLRGLSRDYLQCPLASFYSKLNFLAEQVPTVRGFELIFVTLNDNVEEEVLALGVPVFDRELPIWGFQLSGQVVTFHPDLK